ncbi:beta-N-acetylhexosaminidase [Rhodovibrionaceae bacterium A322]
MASKTPSAVIFGCAGLKLSEQERAFFRESAPLGFILFARNVDTPEQVRRLIDELQATVDHQALVLVDQEGGRVQRLRAPHWREMPAVRGLGELYEKDPQAGLRASWLHGRLLAAELAPLGFNVDCWPCLDLLLPEGHGIIGDRAFSADPDQVAALGRAGADGLLAGGVLPVIKHLPGHGRAPVDSHLELPRVTNSAEVLESSDFAPFRALADLPLGMTAHVIYAALEDERPATTSEELIQQVIRRDLGFDGLLMSDDLSMKALQGDFGSRTKDSLAAGCDLVLHCNGEPTEMAAVMAEVPPLSAEGLRRWQAAEALMSVQSVDEEAALEEYRGLMNL